jgi:mono/diheme cytochrome c family protein
MRALSRILLAGAALALVPAMAFAADEDLGKKEFDGHCAVCHGEDGKGNGPFAEMLKSKLPDLTTLKQRNDGTFPEDRVRQIIDGRTDVAQHGPRDMPVWGREYSMSAVEYYKDYYGMEDAERFVNSRVTALVGYLESIQQ